MKHDRPWRVSILGWGNMLIGVFRPLSALLNILGALRVFRFEYASGSIFIATFLGLALGFLNWRSGWGILRDRPWAFKQTCVAGGFTFGYTFFGTFVMTTAGANGDLIILLDFGSRWWLTWTLSHFQDSCLREIPLMCWWVFGIGTVVRHCVSGAPESVRNRFIAALRLVFPFVLLGIGARMFQCMEDALLYSQR